MTLRILRTPAAFVFSTLLLATFSLAQTRPTAPESPYGGTTVEEIIARVNDQIITRSDYDRAMKELDTESRQRGASMQDISASHRDLLRNQIDQRLWLSKGKELGIDGESELVKKLDDIRKQYNLENIEDLEKAATAQGISFEDFKANIRNGIITQLVMRDQVGRKIQFTPGEAERYFEQHKQEYVQPESVRLSEIMVSIGTAAPSATIPGAAQLDDPDKLAAAQTKADEIEAKLRAGGDFAQLARSFSDGPTASEGGDLGQFRRGALAKVLEDQTFVLQSGQFTSPIRTKQGYVILKVTQHVPGGVPAYKDVQETVEQNFYMARMEPAMREYLTTMREQAFIDIKPGYADTGTSPKQTKPTFSAYTPPAPKKKAKAARTRYRETTHTFRLKSAQGAPPPPADTAVAPDAAKLEPAVKGKSRASKALKPGKKEKIRYGQAPSKTLPNAPETKTEDAGAVDQAATVEQENSLEAAPRAKKSRYSARAKVAKQPKVKGAHPDAQAPAAPESAEVADRQTQSGPLGLSGDTATKKKKKVLTTSGEKTRLADRNKKTTAQPQNSDGVSLAPAPQAAPVSAPTTAPAPPPQQ